MKHSMRFSLLVASALVCGCSVIVPGYGLRPENTVWACHGGRNPTWRRINVNAANGHQRHGDLISQSPQREGERCGPGREQEQARGRDRHE